MADPNRAFFESVVHLLASVLDELVFVGGCTTGVFITDPAAGGIRPTKDVDAIADRGFRRAAFEPELSESLRCTVVRQLANVFTSACVEGVGSGRRAMGLSLVCLLLAGTVAGEQSNPFDPFERVSFLIGRWEGTSEGQPGKGTVRREYARALNGRFVRVRNRNEYPPQEKNPKAEVHEDEGFISFDRARKKLVYRQFHVEGFVNQYVEDVDSSPAKVIFTSESIENIPAGWRARETYVVHGPDEVEEIFELAESGKPFALYSRARLKRVQ